MFEKLNISTTTMVGNCDCSFDIDVIFDKLNINEHIIKLRCNNKEKTKDAETICKTFYNQITVKFQDNMNIKLFNNGKFQITGVKDVSLASKNLQILLNCIKDIYGTTLATPKYYKGVYVIKNKIIKPYKDGYICDNFIKSDKILIDNNICEQFDLIPGLMIQKNHIDKKKILYNHYGQEVGFVSFVMTRKNKNLCIKDAEYIKQADNLFTIHKKIDIGTLEISCEDFTCDKPPENIKLYYRCCSKTPMIKEKQLANTNYNTKISMTKNQEFDRTKFCSYLQEKNIKFIYERSKYPGVKLSILDTKITIFRTGSILFSKRDEKTDINLVLKTLEEILSNNFIKDIKTHKNEEKTNTDTSIWDLI